MVCVRYVPCQHETEAHHRYRMRKDAEHTRLQQRVHDLEEEHNKLMV